MIQLYIFPVIVIKLCKGTRNGVEEWCNDNNMFNNKNKTKYMIITKQRAMPHHNESCKLLKIKRYKLPHTKVSDAFVWNATAVLCVTLILLYVVLS